MHTTMNNKHIELTNLDLNLLKVLHALMCERNVTRAAESLALSQSAVSHALKRLRQALNDPLFVATPSGMEPTLRARELAEPTGLFIQTLSHKLKQNPEFDPAASDRVFKIAGGGHFELIQLPRLLRILSQEQLSVQIHNEPLTQSDYHDELLQGKVDLVFGVRGMTHLADNLKTGLVQNTEMVLVVHESHPLAQRQSLSLEEMAAQPQIFTSYWSGPKNFLDQRLQQNGLKRNVVTTVQGYASVPAILENTELMIVMIKPVALYFQQHYPLKLIQAPRELTDISSFFAWHPLHDNDPGHIWLRQQLANVINDTV
ncbi:LysR family transcriptional regulator [Pontibacterium sp.]|uniref:LysR family transcriptional regulator n=2 Tax=Pontibacterium sp. TaxID=2036026 RepID=UPI003515B8B5